MKKTSKFGIGRRTLEKKFSIFLIARFNTSYIPKIRLLAGLGPEIAMKQTSKLGNGRRP